MREIKQLLAKPQQRQNAATPSTLQTPQNLTVKGGAIYVLGKSDAPLTLVEFTDYQCPFCARFEAAIFPEIKRRYIDTGALRLIALDGDTYKRCMADDKHLKNIRSEAKYAQSLGITGTPTFILGKADGDSVEGRVIVGAQPLTVFETA